MTRTTCHIPVMLKEVLSYLNVAQGGSFLDCTMGGAGHSEEILKANAANQLVATDRDARAVERALIRLAPYGSRVEIKHAKFSEVEDAISGQKFNGMLADLGISTDQISEQRGFSFKDPTPLDMRMDETQEITAATIVNEFSERDLYVTLREGGVGNEAKEICRAIMRARPISRTDELAQIISDAVKGRYREKHVHPATVVFQALRMKVNNERGEIDALLNSAPKLVASGGRFVVITFHSIEDKVVTHKMRAWQQGGAFSALSPGSRPSKTLGRLVEKKAVAPTEAEISENPSARSARLRIFEFA